MQARHNVPTAPGCNWMHSRRCSTGMRAMIWACRNTTHIGNGAALVTQLLLKFLFFLVLMCPLREVWCKIDKPVAGNQHTRELINTHITQTQQQRPESLMVTQTWHTSKYMVQGT